MTAFGVSTTVGLSIFSRRYVTNLYLHEGGEKVSIETLNVFGRRKMIEVNIADIKPTTGT